MAACRSRSPPRRTSGSPPAPTSTPRASGCRRGPPGMRSRRRSTTGAPAGRAGSTGGRRPRRRGRSFARLIGVEPSTVAVGATVSGLRRARRVLAPRRVAGSRPRDRVHLDALSVPRRGAPRRHGAHGAGRRAGRGDRRDDRPRRVQRRPDGDRRGGRPRGDRGRRPGARGADPGRRDPGLRVAAARRQRVRHRRRGRLQVAPLAARHRLHGGRARRASEASSRRRPGGTPARTCTRRTSARRCASQPTPAGSTPHPPGTAGSGPPLPWR